MITRSESTNFSNLSPDLIHNFKQLFKFIDVDNDNSINKQDIQKLIRIINLNDKVNVDEMFPVNSDSITYPEFLSIMGKLFQGFPNNQQLREALTSFADEVNQKDLNKIDVDHLFEYLIKTDFYITKKEEFVKQWKHFILSEKGTNYFLGENFLKTFE
jgi:Ca2+-binding EF-hand superfamily protein